MAERHFKPEGEWLPQSSEELALRNILRDVRDGQLEIPEAVYCIQQIESPEPVSTPRYPDRAALEAVAEDGLLVTWDKDYKFPFSQVVRLMAEFVGQVFPLSNPQRCKFCKEEIFPSEEWGWARYGLPSCPKNSNGHEPIGRDDPICGNCHKPESEHAGHGDWCPANNEDKLFSGEQKFRARQEEG